MLSEERIKLMTRLSVFEERTGRRDLKTGTYFRGDFIGKELLKGFLSATLVYFLICAGYVIYNFEGFMKDIYQIDLLASAKSLANSYMFFLVCYLVFCYLLTVIRYSKARRSLRRYQAGLSKLSSMYQEESVR